MMRLAICALAATTAALAVTPAVSQNQQKPAPPPPCQEEIYRAFDFWLGTWDVTTPDGKPAGTNVISEQEKGCLLLEEWTSASGNTGQSYNFYDPAIDKWRQVWVSGGAVIDYSGGLNNDGAMVLEGDIHYRNNTQFPFRGTWTLQDDGTVKQHFQQYNPETEEWADWFIGIYKKKE